MRCGRGRGWGSLLRVAGPQLRVPRRWPEPQGRRRGLSCGFSDQVGVPLARALSQGLGGRVPLNFIPASGRAKWWRRGFPGTRWLQKRINLGLLGTRRHLQAVKLEPFPLSVFRFLVLEEKCRIYLSCFRCALSDDNRLLPGKLCL